MEEGIQNRQQPAPQAPPRNQVGRGRPRGPRNLWLSRGENGFGFTLRHFVVYPPESYTKTVDNHELMDTIFVKNVYGAAAKQAGLTTGDRIVGVNGQSIVGKSYAAVVQQIQNTPDRLHLLVVPKEDDIIQQCYSETAHHPWTNPRPRLRSPEAVTAVPQRRDSGGGGLWSPPVASSSSSLATSYASITPEPIYQAPIWSADKGYAGRGLNEVPGSQNDGLPVISPSNVQSSRLSFDGSSVKSIDSSSTLTDDSQIISRIYRSCAQKKEFLENPTKLQYPLRVELEQRSSVNSSPNSSNSSVHLSNNNIIQREFYGRPQRLNNPHWPPPNIDDDKQKYRQLSKIHEDHRTDSFDSDAVSSNSDDRVPSRLQSEEKETGLKRALHQPQIHIVSSLTREFEAGQIQQGRISHCSELKRLSAKQPAPKVSVRRQEFEQRSCGNSFDRSTPTSPPILSSTNRTILVGSTTIHATPPSEYDEAKHGEVDNEVRLRSNSVDSWSSHDEALKAREAVKEKQRHKAVRQDSYLAAVKTLPTPKTSGIRRSVLERRSSDEGFIKTSRKTARSSPLSTRKTVSGAAKLNLPRCKYKTLAGRVAMTATVPAAVTHRVRATTLSPDERALRRVSYVRANSDDQHDLIIDSDQQKHAVDLHSSTNVEEPVQKDTSAVSPINKSYVNEARRPIITDETSKENIIKEGPLNYKLSMVEGKRATDRSWKPIWATLRGRELVMARDRDTETIPLTGCRFDIPADYIKKKKNVLRIRTPQETEYLLQTEDATEFDLWRRMLREEETNDVLSPTAAQKGLIKLTGLRTRSPTGQSPVCKTRKAVVQETTSPQTGVSSTSPKPAKTWKGKLGKPFRRIGVLPPDPTSPSPTDSMPPSPLPIAEGATIGIPLERCPPSKKNPLVPSLVEKCTDVVETRGLDIVGVYRVPGNTASVTGLTADVNRGMHLMDDEDPRWNDVNVISSLLKAFFRNLPDSLFTAELYPKFIAADKIADPKLRMITLRKLLEELPEHNYETLKHLLYHLKKVVGNSEVNKMETRNLAIVFGPTLVRPADLLAMIQDTSQQCRIIESLITYVDWFFSNDDVETLGPLAMQTSNETNQHPEGSPNSANLLLNNIHRIEGGKDPNKYLVSSIISAANRKISRKPKKLDKQEVSFEKIKTSSISSIRTEMTSSSSTTEDTVDTSTSEENVRFKQVSEWVSSNSATTANSHRLTSSNQLAGKVGSCESLTKEDSSNKRFKSSRENCSTSLESLNVQTSNDGINLVAVMTENFDQKLQAMKQEKEAEEKAELEKDEKEVIMNVLRAKNSEIRVKRSESLNTNRTDRIDPRVRRSESLGKNDYLMTKWEKTETNLMTKQKLRRTWSKEKENGGGGGGGGGKRKGIKRRHTVGGTKDFDQWQQVRNPRRGLRTSSPDLSFSRMQIEVNLLNPDGSVVATLRQDLKPSAASRPQSLPPQTYKTPPLESHV